MKPCVIEGCDHPANARGMCRAHYQRWRRTGDPVSARPKSEMTCQADGCTKPSRAQGLCQVHYLRAWRKGEF